MEHVKPLVLYIECLSGDKHVTSFRLGKSAGRRKNCVTILNYRKLRLSVMIGKEGLYWARLFANNLLIN